MSTAVTSQPRPGGTAPTVQGPSLSFARLLQVELRKMVDTVSGRWLLGIILVSTLAALAIVAWVNPAADLTFRSLIQAVNMVQALLLPIIGVLAATAEWSKRTGLVTFTLEPRRVRVAMAKVLAALVLSLATFAVGLVLAALTYVVRALSAGATMDWSVPGWATAGLVAMTALGVMQGVGFGMLLGSTPLAIVAIYILPTILSIVSALITSAQRVLAWIDPGATQAPLSMGQALTGEQWGQLATSSAIWIVLPIVLGTAMLLRREVK